MIVGDRVRHKDGTGGRVKDLTQAEAERCARALKWTYVDNGAMEYWAPPGAGSGDVPIWVRVWSDPYFWFPRLWLEAALLDEEEYSLKNLIAVSRRLRDLRVMCLALCEAIEALEGK